MPGRYFGHRAPLLWLVLPMMAGLAAGRALQVNASWPWLVGASIAAVVTLILAGKNVIAFSTALVLTLFFSGIASFALHRPRIAAWDALPPREATLTLKIDRCFAARDPSRASGLGVIVSASAPLEEIVGQRAYFSVRLKKGQAAPIRAAVIISSGVIESLPRAPPANSFESYLADAGINFRLGRARLVKELRPPARYYAFCAQALQRFSDLLGAGVLKKRPALVGVFRAMMLGQQNELSEDQTLVYRTTGTMHVFSISGLHVAVIATGLHALLSLARLPRIARCPIALTALWLYVDISGAAPSAIRAFVMVAVIEAALVFQRPHNPLSAIATSALLILFFDPLQFFSASFQMSYGIVAALLLLGLPLSESWQERLALFRHLPKATWHWRHHSIDYLWRATLSALGISAAASLVGTLMGIQFFELVTPGAFLANLWLIPVSALVIYMGMLSLIFGLMGWAFGTLLANHAAVLILWGIDVGIRFCSRLPAMSHPAKFQQPTIGTITLVVLMGLMIWGYSRAWRGLHRGYWAPFALMTGILIFGVSYK